MDEIQGHHWQKQTWKLENGAIFSERYFGDIGYLLTFLLGAKFQNTCMYTFDVIKGSTLTLDIADFYS